MLRALSRNWTRFVRPSDLPPTTALEPLSSSMEASATAYKTYLYGFHPSVTATGDPELQAIPELNDMKLQRICAGLRHVIASVDGRLVAWGCNEYGQCGPLENESIWKLGFSFSGSKGDEDDVPMPTLLTASIQEERVVKLSAGLWHNMALTKSGEVWTWGAGILGHGQEVYDVVPRPVEMTKVYKHDDGELDRRTEFDFNEPEHLVARDVASGSNYSLALAQDGRSLYGWGYLPGNGTSHWKLIHPTTLPILEGIADDMDKLSLKIDATSTQLTMEHIAASQHHYSVVLFSQKCNQRYLATFGHVKSACSVPERPYYPMYEETNVTHERDVSQSKRMKPLSISRLQTGVRKVVGCPLTVSSYVLYDSGVLDRVSEHGEAKAALSLSGIEDIDVNQNGLFVVDRKGKVTRFELPDLTKSHVLLAESKVNRIACGYDFAVFTTVESD